MNAHFKDRVQTVLTSSGLGELRFVEGEDSEAFGDSLVVFEKGPMIFRAVRDRGQVFADFGAVRDPGTWFDASIVAQRLAIELDPRIGSDDEYGAIDAMSSFIRQNLAQLLSLFAPEHYSRTKWELSELEKRAAGQRFGPSQS